MKLVHWVNFPLDNSGMYSYIQQSVRAAQKLGIESRIAFCNIPDSHPYVLQPYVFPTTSIAHKDTMSRDCCVNIIHSGVPPVKLKQLPNLVFETHGMPEYILQNWEALTYTASMLKQCDITITRWANQAQAWRAYTDKPVHVIPPGVDLDLWRQEGSQKPFSNHPLILWADSWRDGIKEPWRLLYQLKQHPELTLKMVNIPDRHRDRLHYVIGELGLGNNIEWSIEGRVSNIADYYRGADFVYSEWDDNVKWEALACGVKCITDLSGERPTIETGVFDIKDNVRSQVAIYQKEFGL